MATKKKAKKQEPGTIQFKVRLNPLPNTKEKAPYIGEVVHNGTASYEDILNDVAASMGGQMSKTEIAYILAAFMRRAMEIVEERCCSVDLGLVTLRPVMKGTLPYKDSKFDPKRNKLEIVVEPSARLRNAASGLKPVNVTPAKLSKPRIDSVCQGPAFKRNRFVAAEPFEIHGAALTVRHGDESAVLELPDGGTLAVTLTRQAAGDGTQRVRARLAEVPTPLPKHARLLLKTHGMGGRAAPLKDVRSGQISLL